MRKLDLIDFIVEIIEKNYSIKGSGVKVGSICTNFHFSAIDFYSCKYRRIGYEKYEMRLIFESEEDKKYAYSYLWKINTKGLEDIRDALVYEFVV